MKPCVHNSVNYDPTIKQYALNRFALEPLMMLATVDNLIKPL